MNILLTSIIDLEKTTHSRLHQIIKYLVKNHTVTLMSINDCWKSEKITADLSNPEISSFLNKVEIKKFTDKKMSPIRQELNSRILLPRLFEEVDCTTFDVHFNYNTLFSGYYSAKKLKKIKINTVYDIADNLPAMIKNSPQINRYLGGTAGYFGRIMVQRNIGISKKVTYITRSLRNNLSIPDEKALLIPNGVDIDLFKKIKNQDSKKKMGLEDNFIIGFLGALREWVDFVPLFEAVKELKTKYPNLKVLIIGEEEGLNQVKEQAKRLHIQENVIFNNAVPYDQVPKNINCMDACVIPFVKDKIGEDSLPLKLFEYMACEKPVISTELKGIKEAVSDNVLYATNKNEYIQQIMALYEDNSLREKMGKNGRKFVEKEYSWSRILGNFSTLLEDAQ